MTTTPPQIGDAGIVDDQVTYDYRHTLIEDPAAAKEDEAKEITIRVPKHLPDNMVRNAWEVGMGTLQRLQQGLIVIAYPSIGKGPDGKMVNTIGKYDVLITSPKDVQYLLEVAVALNKINLEMSKQGSNPVNALTATVEGKRAKENVVRETISKANGLVPLQIPRKAPAASAKGIEIFQK